MASSLRTPAPRRATSSSPAPPAIPKPSVTVEDWESRAPLSELAVRSVAVIKAACLNPPLPLKFTTDGPSDDTGTPRPSTPNLRGGNKLKAGSRPSTPLSSRVPNHALHPKQPVQTPEQFYDWFALIDRSVAHSQEAHFRAHVASVAEHLDTCDKLIQTVHDVDREVDDMLEGWRGVEEGGKNLKDACERLLEERDRLLELTDEIGDRLDCFNKLDDATRLLNHPGDSLVLHDDFLTMVQTVSDCIEYLKDHRHFREAEVYLLRFRQCMTRAMTLIKMFFLGSLRALSIDIQKRLSEKDVSRTAQMHLLYTRFRSTSSQLSPLLRELEHRAQAHPDELDALLSECHSAYFSARKSLISGPLNEEIRGLDPSRTELVELTRAGCSYLKQLCTDEFNLYREFFNSGENSLYQYLETLCDHLYDDLRPRILHEPRLTALCEVCTVLQALMVLDVSALPDDLSSVDDEDNVDELMVDLGPTTPKRRRQGLGRLHISQLLQMVLQDAQTRLFFKAQSVIQSDIKYYVVKPDDLAYPDKLITARQPVSATGIKEKEVISQIFQMPSLDKKGTWFPTLQKVVWVLSQLHEFVKPAIFEDIAQEAISLCRQSLVAASQNIAARNPPMSGLDGSLFLVRHLLILKEITNKLDLVQRDVELNITFAGVTETLASVLNRTSALLPQTLFASLGMPRHDIREVTQGIDQELRKACEDVIIQACRPICEPLLSWIDRVQSHKQASESAPPPSALPWADRSAAEKLDLGFRQSCERDLRNNVLMLKLYLEDEKTVGVLLQHVQDKIMDDYAAFRDATRNMYKGEMRDVVMSATSLRGLLRGICVDDAAGGSSY
ncbi:Sec34-like family-domain-containing protein [Mycena floridula]|nr:Sec34-like family-domain-containing protein [Mycena floridula]